MMRRGGWRPGKWTCRDQRIIISAAYIAAWVRAMDYATGDRGGTARVAEAIMPLQWWAILLTVGELALAVGWVQRRHAVVTIGHAALGLLYTALAVGTLMAYVLPVLASLDDGNFDLYALDGIRNAGPLAVVALVHVITALRTGVEPLPLDAEQPIEVTAAGTGDADG